MNEREKEETSRRISKWLMDPVTMHVLDECELFARQRKQSVPTEQLVGSMFACAALSCKHDGRLEMIDFIKTLPQAVTETDVLYEEPSYDEADAFSKPQDEAEERPF